MMNKWRAYIKPFDDTGAYQADWIEITKDVDFNSMGDITSQLDNTDFDIGVYRNSSFRLVLKNERGLYSDVGFDKSIFHYKRANSLFKLTWEIAEEGPLCGMVTCGEFYTSEETTAFIGLIRDEAAPMELGSQTISFSCLGRESVFQDAIVPYADLVAGSLFSAILFACLNQTSITKVLTVGAGNISCGTDIAVDTLAPLEGKTVQEALGIILMASNSVMTVVGDAVVVKPRTPTPSVVFSLYGQASPLGPENVADLREIRNGFAKIFNFCRWADTASTYSDPTSLAKYGAKLKEVSCELITDTAKRQTIMAAIVNEFREPKQEFDVHTPLNYKSMALKPLDRLNFDYPTVYIPGDDAFPICGLAICGEAVMPKAQWSFTLEQADHYKILSRSINVSKAMVKLKVRAV